MTKKQSALTGAVSGFLNGLFGSAGGVFAVMLSEKYGREEKNAHAESLALMLPLSVVSAVCCYLKGARLSSVLWAALPAGLAGAALGAALLKKIPVPALKRIFGIFLIFAGVRGLIA